jgi:hypothetical protein
MAMEQRPEEGLQIPAVRPDDVRASDLPYDRRNKI